MRVTVDIDSKNPIVLTIAIIKGIILCRSFPQIEKSRRGFHLIWHGLNIDEKKMLLYRRLIGDDENRIMLDSISDKRIKQVLFTEKKFIDVQKLLGENDV